jgi:septum formation protein
LMTMRYFSDRFIASYLESEKDDVCQSVGGYKLEGRGIQLFANVEGGYFDILGLPLLPLLAFLRTQGIVGD